MMKTIKFWILDSGFWIGKAKDNFAEKPSKLLTPSKTIRNNSKFKIQNAKSGELGAALVGLLALMAIIALLLLAVAPSISQQIQRERELEAIRRGDEIAEAIRIFALRTNGLPKTMDELLEGVSVPGRTKKLMILRESAAKDPLSSTGEWKLVQSGDFKTLANFQSKLSRYSGSTAFTNPEPKKVFELITQGIISTIVDIKTSEETDPPGGEDDSANIDAPFVGVTSRTQTKSVLTFYGIERHDWWVFTPLFRGAGTGQNIIPRSQPTPADAQTGKPLDPPN